MMNLYRRNNIAQWTRLAAAAALPLFVARLGLEWMPLPPLWVWIGVALVLAGGALLYHTALPIGPLSVLWGYILWPALSPSMAASLAFVALVGTAIATLQAKMPDAPPSIWDGLVFVAGLILYLATLAPTILPADSGEFQIVGPVLGVAHPPGYALFTMIAKAFSLIPFGEVAWRVNLMGAVTGALSLAVVHRTARRMSNSAWSGIAAAGTLGFSTTFWAQSTTINIRAFVVLFTALCLHYLIEFLRAPPASQSGSSALLALAFSFGLLVSHHYPQAAFAPVFAIVVLWHDPTLIRRVRTWPRYLGAAVIPFAADLYIVFRAYTGAPFGTADLVDAGRVLDHLLGRGFSGDMFAFLRLERILWERFLVVGNILLFQFGAIVLCLAAAGAACLAWQKRKQALLLGGVFAVMAFIVATYRAPQSVEYLLPAYLPVALCTGYLVGLAAPTAASMRQRAAPTRILRALLAAVLLLPIAALGYNHLPSYLELHRDCSARIYAESVLLQAPPDAHILSNWHWYTPLRYLQLVEGQRPDVRVTYLFPQGETTMPYAWPQRIARELQASDRPLIVTNYYPTYADLPYRFLPHGEAYRVQRAPSRQLPADLAPLDLHFGQRIRLAGYRVTRDNELHPGDWLTVDLAWQPTVRLDRGYSFSVQLIGPDGLPYGQQDRRHDRAPSYEPGEVLVDQYQFPIYTTAAPGSYALVASVYFTEPGGQWDRLALPGGDDVTTLQRVAVAPGLQPPVTMHPTYRPFTDRPLPSAGPILVGVDYDHTLPGQERVYLHWRSGDRPLAAELSAREGLLGRRIVAGTAQDGYISIAFDVPPLADDLRLTLYDLETGAPVPRRGIWGVSAQTNLALPDSDRRQQHYLPLGGKMALVRVRSDRTWPAGSTQRVALSFLSLKPIVRDYVISVSVRGDDLARTPSDSVPALGAIPTFKWIRGARVHDVHLIEVLDQTSGQAQLTIGVYDAFTMRALPPLDERIARLGLAGVPLGTVSVP